MEQHYILFTGTEESTINAYDAPLFGK